MGHLDGSGRSTYANGREISFSRTVAATGTTGLAPRCLEAVEATDNSAWHLLLEDLTDSHFIATEWPLPPTSVQCESIVQALARFHAAWWDSPLLGASVGAWYDPDAVNQGLRAFAEHFPPFTDRFGEFVPPERRSLYHLLLHQPPPLLALSHSPPHRT